MRRRFLSWRRRTCGGILGVACTAVVVTVLLVLLMASNTPTVPKVRTSLMPSEMMSLVQPNTATAILNTTPCPASPLLLVVVCSAPSHQQQRDAIRSTWGADIKARQDAVLIFLLGVADNQSTQVSVYDEASLHGDVVVEDFIDTYMNLTVKTLFLLKWATRHCGGASYVFKTDDDMYVNIPNLMSLLHKESNTGQERLLGFLYKGLGPLRDPASKWFVSEEEYPGNNYPEFLSGTGYIIPGKLVPILLKEALRTPSFFLEDVFLTGIVTSQRLGFPVAHVQGFHRNSPFWSHPCLYKNLITAHDVNVEVQKSVWLSLNHPNDMDCDRFTIKVVDYIYNTWLS